MADSKRQGYGFRDLHAGKGWCLSNHFDPLDQSNGLEVMGKHFCTVKQFIVTFRSSYVSFCFKVCCFSLVLFSILHTKYLHLNSSNPPVNPLTR